MAAITVLPIFHLLQVLLAAALAVALPTSTPLLDQLGDTTAWVLPPPDRVTSDQPQANLHLTQPNLALNNLGVRQPGTSCELHLEDLRSAPDPPPPLCPQSGHDIAAATVMPTFHLLQISYLNSAASSRNGIRCILVM